jgi:hypothetical protein
METKNDQAGLTNSEQIPCREPISSSTTSGGGGLQDYPVFAPGVVQLAAMK